MGVAVVPYPNDPAFTDGDWTDDFEFYVDSLATPDSFADATGAVASFTSQLSGSWQVSTQAGTLALVNGNTWQVRAPQSLMGLVNPGTYVGELRLLGPGAAVTPILVWRQPVIAGASAGWAPNNPDAPAGGTTNALQIIQGETMQIIRSGGRQGWSALDVLINAGLLPAGSGAADFAAYLATLGRGAMNLQEVPGGPMPLNANWNKAVTTTAATKGLRISDNRGAGPIDRGWFWTVVPAGAAAPGALDLGEFVEIKEDFEAGIPIGDIYLRSPAGAVVTIFTA